MAIVSSQKNENKFYGKICGIGKVVTGTDVPYCRVLAYLEEGENELRATEIYFKMAQSIIISYNV
jgi:hypothetical protein